LLGSFEQTTQKPKDKGKKVESRFQWEDSVLVQAIE